MSATLLRGRGRWAAAVFRHGGICWASATGSTGSTGRHGSTGQPEDCKPTTARRPRGLEDEDEDEDEDDEDVVASELDDVEDIEPDEVLG